MPRASDMHMAGQYGPLTDPLTCSGHLHGDGIHAEHTMQEIAHEDEDSDDGRLGRLAADPVLPLAPLLVALDER